MGAPCRDGLGLEIKVYQHASLLHFTPRCGSLIHPSATFGLAQDIPRQALLFWPPATITSGKQRQQFLSEVIGGQSTDP
jgi:hypothetical protein